MADVATLGLAVDSSQLDKGVLALDQLSNSAKRAEAAASGVSGATKNAGAAAASIAAQSRGAAEALTAEATAAGKAAAALRLHSVAANQNISGLKSANISNIAAQFQDIAVSSAAGMGALQVGLQQGTQLAAVIAAMESPLKGLGAAFLSVLSPVSLLVIAMTALAAEAIHVIDWAKVGAAALRGIAAVLPEIAQGATYAGAALAIAFGPQILRSVVSLTVALATGLVDALTAVAVAAAANPFTAMVLAIAALIAAAYVFRDEITKILGFDIFAAARDGANKLIGVFVGTYNGIVDTWHELPNALGDVIYQGANNFLDGLRTMIRKAIGEWNTFIYSLENTWRDTPMAGVAKSMEIQYGEHTFDKDQWELRNPYEGKSKSVDAIFSDDIKQAQGKDYIGTFGDWVTKGAGAAAEALKKLAEQLGLVDDKSNKHHGKTDAELYSDIVAGANRRIASLKAEAAGLGLTEEAALKLRYTQDLLNQAQEKGISLSSAQKAQLSTLAGDMASTETAINKASDALSFAHQTTRSFFGDLKNGLESGKSLWRSFADAAINALDRISDRLLDKFVDSLFEGTDASSAGGLFGFLLKGVAGKTATAANDNIQASPTGLRDLIFGGSDKELDRSLATTAKAVPAGMGAYRDAIAAVESLGNGGYAALGPVLKNGNQALGRYQIMRSNLPSWSMDALGRHVSQSEFMASPRIQDAIFDHRFGGYLSKYGNDRDAASAWFTGQPLSRGAHARDVLGTSGSEYVAKFEAAKASVEKLTGSVVHASSSVDKMASSAMDAGKNLTDGLGNFGKSLSQFPAAPSGGGGISNFIASAFSGFNPWKYGGGVSGGGVGLFADGTENAPAGWAWVGERGPELRKLRAGDVIRNNGRSNKMAANSNSRPIVQVTHQVINNTGAQVSTQQSEDDQGNIRVETRIDRAVADAITRRGNRSQKALQSMGVSAPMIRR